MAQWGQQPMQGMPSQQMNGMQLQGMQCQYGQPHMDGKDFGAMGSIGEAPPYIRSDFIRKVYTILSIQLFATFAIAFYMNTQLSDQWILAHRYLFYGISMLTMGMLLGVSCCCAEAMRRFPMNYIFLALLTLGTAVSTGLATTFYSTSSVLMALGTTSLVFFALTAYACFTKTDFTGFGPYLFAGLMGLMFFGLFIQLWPMFTGYSLPSSVHLLYACGGVLLFIFYIIFDTQKIVGGQHTKHQFAIDDYAFAALALYLDIVNLFMMILQLFGNRE